MSLGQPGLDRGLALQQPVQGGVQFVLVYLAQPEAVGEAVGGGRWGQAPRGGQLRARVEDAGHDHGGHQVALAAAARCDQRFQPALAQSPEDGRDVPVGQRAHDLEGVGQGGLGGRPRFEGAPHGVDGMGRQLGEVGEGAFVDL